MPFDKQPFINQAKIFKALGHPDRLLMVSMVQDSPKCVSDLQQAVGTDMSTVSRHLTVLREAGIVKAEKKKAQIYYSLDMPCLKSVLLCTCQKSSAIEDGEFKGIRIHGK